MSKIDPKEWIKERIRLGPSVMDLDMDKIADFVSENIYKDMYRTLRYLIFIRDEEQDFDELFGKLMSITDYPLLECHGFPAGGQLGITWANDCCAVVHIGNIEKAVDQMMQEELVGSWERSREIDMGIKSTVAHEIRHLAQRDIIYVIIYLVKIQVVLRMELTKTAKLQIYPSDNDKSLLLDSMRAYADACNFISHYVYTTKDLSQVSVQKYTYDTVRTVYNLPSQMACNAVRTVIGSYKTNRTNGFDWTECKYNTPQMTLSWNRDYSINQDKFSVGTLCGRIKTDYASSGMEQYFDKSVYRFGTAKVVCKHNKFFLHISVSFNSDELKDADVCNVVGHDRGIRFITSSYGSNGKTTFFSGNQVKQKRAHYKALRKQLQRVGTSSSRRRLKAIGQRENRWMQDVNHQVSKTLVESNPKGTLHVIEDLSGIRSATERVKVKDRYVSVSWSYYDLEQKLTYKANEHGQKVIKVDPRYTSQTCPRCGHVDKANRDKRKHVFCCKNCGYRSNDDRIGAMNLYRMGIEYLVKSQTSISGL